MSSGHAKVLERDPRVDVDDRFARAETFGCTIEQPGDRPPLEVAAHEAPIAESDGASDLHGAWCARHLRARLESDPVEGRFVRELVEREGDDARRSDDYLPLKEQGHPRHNGFSDVLIERCPASDLRRSFDPQTPFDAIVDAGHG